MAVLAGNTLVSLRVTFICIALKGLGRKEKLELGVGSGSDCLSPIKTTLW